MCYVYLLRLWWIANFVYFYHLGIEMNNFETRLMLDNLRSELNNFKMEVHLEMRMNRVKQTDSTAVAGMLSTLSADIRSDLVSLLKRQDMLFHKQDQIQCTLSGETPPASHSGGFQSPPSSSVLTWSSVPSNTPRQPSKSPLHPPSMIQQQGLPLQSAVGLPEESSEYLYGFNDISSSLLEEDLPYSGKIWRALNLANHSPKHIGEFLIWRDDNFTSACALRDNTTCAPDLDYDVMNSRPAVQHS